MGRSQAVRQRILIPPFGGSIPPAPASTQAAEFIMEVVLVTLDIPGAFGNRASESALRIELKSVRSLSGSHYGIRRAGFLGQVRRGFIVD